jgi:hypothetical protein
MAAAAALVVALLAGLVGAELGRRRALDEASRGWGAHVEAKLAAGWLGDLLATATRAEPGWLATVEEREAELAATFAGHTEAEALARLGLARLFAEHGMGRRAEPHLDRVLALARTPGSGVGPAEVRRARELEAAIAAAAGR